MKKKENKQKTNKGRKKPVENYSSFSFLHREVQVRERSKEN